MSHFTSDEFASNLSQTQLYFGGESTQHQSIQFVTPHNTKTQDRLAVEPDEMAVPSISSLTLTDKLQIVAHRELEKKAPRMMTLDEGHMLILLDKFDLYFQNGGVQHLLELVEPEFREFWAEYVGHTLSSAYKLSNAALFDLLCVTIHNISYAHMRPPEVYSLFKMPQSDSMNRTALFAYIQLVRLIVKRYAAPLSKAPIKELIKKICLQISPSTVRDDVIYSQPTSVDEVCLNLRTAMDSYSRGLASIGGLPAISTPNPSPVIRDQRPHRYGNKREGSLANVATIPVVRFPREVFGIHGECFGCLGPGPYTECVACSTSLFCAACGPSVSQHKLWDKKTCVARRNWIRLRYPDTGSPTSTAATATTTLTPAEKKIAALEGEISDLKAMFASLAKVRTARLLAQQNTPISLIPTLMKTFHAHALSNVLLDINPPALLVDNVPPSIPHLLHANRSVKSDSVTVDTGASSIFSPTISNLDSSTLSSVNGDAHVQCANGQFNKIDGKGKFLGSDAYVVNSFNNMLLGVSAFCKPQIDIPAKIVVFSPDSAVGILLTPKINAILNNLLEIAQSENLVKLEATQKNGIYITDVESLKSLHTGTKVLSLKHLFAGASTYLTTEFKNIAEKVLFFIMLLVMPVKNRCALLLRINLYPTYHLISLLKLLINGFQFVHLVPKAIWLLPLCVRIQLIVISKKVKKSKSILKYGNIIFRKINLILLVAVAIRQYVVFLVQLRL